MKEVLLAIDQSEERAITQAKTVCDLFDLDDTIAHLFHDFTDNPEGASVYQIASVRSAADFFERVGIEIEYHEASGDPTATIIETAEELDVDAICVAGRKRTPAGKALFGSVAQGVILATERPVLFCTSKQKT